MQINNISFDFTRTLVDNMGEGLLQVDNNDIIQFANNKFCKMSGYSLDKLIGKTGFDTLFDKDEREVIIHKNALRLEKVVDAYEIKMRCRNGSLMWVRISGTPITDNFGEVIGSIGIFTDISEGKLAEEKIRTLINDLTAEKEKAEKSNKLKTEFLAQMSHEIRSPMSVVLNFTSLIKDELDHLLTPALEDYFKIIKSAGNRLIRTVDLILNMSELQIGSYEPSWGNIDLFEEILESILSEYKKYSETKGLSISFRNEASSTRIFGDKYSLTQIFVNLVDNAIKYTVNGNIDVIVKRNESENLCVTVKDTGIGIAKESIDLIFEAFAQEEQGYSRRFEGNGLGLALVKKYCSINNASIAVESEKGKGSIFTVTFKNQ